MEPIDRFYRVRFADSHVLREWSLRALEIAASRSDVPTWALPRVVVFVPPKAPADGVAYGYVSEGARNLVSGAGRGVKLDRAPVSIRELPDGLALLLGDPSDTSAYEQRQAGGK